MANTPPTFPGTTVFVVDPQPAHQRELSALLAKAGLRSRSFDSAESLLLAPPVQHPADGPACIVTELALPGLSGLELIRSLRSRGDATPVIIVTGEADVAAAVNAFRNDIADFVFRPFTERDFVRRLRAVLGLLSPAASPLPSELSSPVTSAG